MFANFQIFCFCCSTLQPFLMKQHAEGGSAQELLYWLLVAFFRCVAMSSLNASVSLMLTISSGKFHSERGTNHQMKEIFFQKRLHVKFML